jgi:type I restriction enzyme S subunit
MAEGAIACMRTKNVQTELDESDLIGVPEEIVKNKEKLLRPGDILVSSANSWNLVGKCCFVSKLDYPATAGGFISILRPINNNVDPRFLYRWFSSEVVQRIVRSFGNQTTNISNLNHKRTLGLKIPLPPLSEQKRIAGILDAADALRAKRREALAQLDTLLQSTFLDMFGDPVTNPMGWDQYPLSEITIKITDGEHLNPEFLKEGIPIVMAGNVLEAGVDLQNAKLVEFSLGEKFRKKCGPEQNDILIVSRGATIGRICVVRTSRPFCLMGSVILVKPLTKKVHPGFLCWFLRHPATRNVLDRTSGSSAQQAIYIKDLRKLGCILPPLFLQHRFASIVQSVEQQKQRMRAHLGELDTLFASLQSRAFNGEL